MNAPCLLAISMATAVRQSNTDGIVRSGISKQTTINKCTNKAGRFDGHHDVAVEYSAHHPIEVVGATMEATGCRHRESIAANIRQ